ncbi:6882_t:CDS:2 [Funneliformis geosporum]|uniref:6882_t:CDS:1 n=1 Tax=Funneliformis geosporum TaxID=1117311 RepID=A0A9W4WTC9_9GLOM|nr:6882_t:CDS:2 [Funneliformis geosporum]
MKIELSHGQDDTSHCFEFDMDSSNEECNNSSLKIIIGQTFHTWEDAEKFLNEYELEKGFSI